MISIHRLSLKLGEFYLRDIELKIPDSEIFAILGKTGSGKTVLLETIAGFYKGNTGEVNLRGENVRNIPVEERKIGFVYQDYALFPHMTVFDNIGYGLKMNNKGKKESERLINEMAELLEIKHLLKCYPGTLSGGERQRTALARALVLNPDLLLMDEPFSALDPKTKEQMYKQIERIHQLFHCTIVFVTHDFNEARRMANRVGVMVNGELMRVCNSEELFEGQKEEKV